VVRVLAAGFVAHQREAGRAAASNSFCPRWPRSSSATWRRAWSACDAAAVCRHHEDELLRSDCVAKTHVMQTVSQRVSSVEHVTRRSCSGSSDPARIAEMSLSPRSARLDSSLSDQSVPRGPT
jgi:hypothetical protein